MEVVLKEDIYNLGKMGDVVRVRDGYARNFLLPRGLVLVANNKNLKALEHEKRVIAAKRERALSTAKSVSEQLSAVSVTIPAKVGEEGKLFGSVTNIHIEKALKSLGHNIERRKIHLAEPIKNAGEHEVPIRLANDVTANIRVIVVSDEETQTTSE
ncbi:MAG: 50S ribosomal protein L9 [Deltaproteobacteria bacterium]|nr:50S ribosomal protein L9 [Deltaproteobacteria bacterium]